MKKIFPYLFVAAYIGFVVFAPSVFAQNVQTPPISNEGDLLRILCRIVSVLFTVLLIFSVGAMIYAAYLYLFGGTDPKKISDANKTIIYAAVAVAVGLLARALPVVVASFLGGSVTAPCAPAGGAGLPNNAW